MNLPAPDLTAKTARQGLTVVACLLLSLALESGASASVAVGTSASASQALMHSLAAATKAGSARITVQFFSGSSTGKVVQDSSLHSGEQTVATGGALASVVLVGGAAYISGNSKGLTSYFGLPSALGPTLAGRWVSLQSTDAAFHAVTANVALSSALVNVTPSGTLTAGKRLKVERQWVKSISGEIPGGGGRLTLFVTANSRSLPVEAVESSGAGKTATGEIVTFTRWGEQLHLVTPSRAIPISTLEAASSASG
jgi:hypothetical protein